MTAHDPFSATRDAEVGRLLRVHLDPGNDVAFVARVRAALLVERDSSWDVLARWTRPGLAAAAALVFGLGLWFSLTRGGEAVTLADAMQPVGAPSQLLAGAEPASTEGVLGALLEGRR